MIPLGSMSSSWMAGAEGSEPSTPGASTPTPVTAGLDVPPITVTIQQHMQKNPDPPMDPGYPRRPGSYKSLITEMARPMVQLLEGTVSRVVFKVSPGPEQTNLHDHTVVKSWSPNHWTTGEVPLQSRHMLKLENTWLTYRKEEVILLEPSEAELQAFWQVIFSTDGCHNVSSSTSL